MTRLTEPQTDAAMAEPWPMPQPGPLVNVNPAPCAAAPLDPTPSQHLTVGYGRIDFAGPEPAHVCANCARLQAELDAMREQRNHFERLALRNRSTTAR